jgi:hypothetical protein
MALTLSYAARYDPPNMLSERICSLLEQLAEDDALLVRQRIREHTLPMVIPLHAARLSDVLSRIVRYADLIPVIGAGLAKAYEYSPTSVLGILDTWIENSSQMKSADRSTTTQREALLAAVAMTYGYIDYEIASGPLTIDDAFTKLEEILKDQHPFVRTAVVLAVSLQAEGHFNRVEPVLHRLVPELPITERKDIVEAFTKVYLKQRANLDNEEITMNIDGSDYPIWIDAKRPLTSIEKAMLNWLQDSKNPTAQQIATSAFVAFANALDIKESNRIATIRKERIRAEKYQAATPAKELAVARGPRHGGFLVDQAIPWIVTLGNTGLRLIISGLLPEVVLHDRYARSTMKFVLERWARTSLQYKTIAGRLKSGVFLAKNVKTIIIVLLVGLAITLFICCCLLLSASS